jgi:hypothetical protein
LKPEKKLSTKAKEAGVARSPISYLASYNSVLSQGLTLLYFDRNCFANGLVFPTDFNQHTTIIDLKKNLKKKLGLDEKAMSFEPLHQLLFDVCNGVIDLMLLEQTSNTDWAQ